MILTLQKQKLQPGYGAYRDIIALRSRDKPPAARTPAGDHGTNGFRRSRPNSGSASPGNHRIFKADLSGGAHTLTLE
jgi:hypothetical protein